MAAGMEMCRQLRNAVTRLLEAGGAGQLFLECAAVGDEKQAGRLVDGVQIAE